MSDANSGSPVANDDGEPVTWDWLRGTPPFKSGCPAIHAGIHRLDFRPHDRMVRLEDKDLPHVRTRGQLRNLIEALTGQPSTF
jgi:hypothetical protein